MGILLGYYLHYNSTVPLKLSKVSIVRDEYEEEERESILLRFAGSSQYRHVFLFDVRFLGVVRYVLDVRPQL